MMNVFFFHFINWIKYAHSVLGAICTIFRLLFPSSPNANLTNTSHWKHNCSKVRTVKQTQSMLMSFHPDQNFTNSSNCIFLLQRTNAHFLHILLIKSLECWNHFTMNNPQNIALNWIKIKMFRLKVLIEEKFLMRFNINFNETFG